MRIRTTIVAVFAVFTLLILAGCGSSPGADGKPPYGEIRNLATGLALWHVNSTGSVDGILYTAGKLHVQVTKNDLNVILDEDERKRMQRIDGIERSIFEQYGVIALVEFRIRHARAVSDLWVESANRTGLDSTLGRAMLGIAAQYLEEGVQTLDTVPTEWHCWLAAGCNPTAWSEASTLLEFDPALFTDGMAAVESLLSFSRTGSPSTADLPRVREPASIWEGKVYAALEALP
jgi:hypothetical protein